MAYGDGGGTEVPNAGFGGKNRVFVTGVLEAEGP